MKKLFSLLAAVLMAGSMMAEGASWIKFETVQPATEVAGSTYGSNGFTLVIPAESDKATVDKNSCTFGLSAEETVSFDYRLKTGGASSKAGRVFTLNIPEEGPLTIYARTATGTDVTRNILITNSTSSSDTIVNHICLDADTLPGKIFLPITVDNVPAGAYTITYPVNAINIYGFKLGVEAPVPTINYWLVGPAAENGWDQTKAMPMPGDSIVRHLNAGTYEFKVLVAEGSWTGALGAADVNATASSANWYGDGNVCFELENEGDVTIKVAEGKIVLTGTFKKQETYDYYIKYAGNNWTWVGMTKAPSGVYMHEGVWGGTGANVNTSMSDNGAAWYPEADIKFINDESEELPVPAIGTKGIYGYELGETPTLYFVYDGTPAPKWDGTVTLSKTTIKSVADLNGVTLTFNGAAKVEFLGGDADIVALQNKDGSEMYAAWHPEYGGSYTIEGNVVTLTGWFDNTEEAPFPKQNATLYVEDYGTFKIDGKADYFETAEVAFEAAAVTTYNVNYSVVGNVDGETSATGMWLSPDYENTGMFVAGDNTVEEGNYVQVVVYYIEGYSAEVKVNNSVVALDPMGLGLGWRDSITADMTIVVTFTKEEGGETTTISKTIAQIVEENKYTISAGSTVTCYTSFKLDEVVTISTTGEPNCGSFWSNSMGTDWRLYQAKSGDITIALATGYELVSITIDYYNSNDGELTGLPFNTKDTDVSGSSKTYVVGNSGTKTTGQVRVLSITVEYKKSTTTGLQNNTVVKAVKTLENGKVVITRDGVRYNIMGGIIR